MTEDSTANHRSHVPAMAGARRLITTLLLAVFVIEAAIMFALPYVDGGTDDVLTAAIDSAILTVLLFPVVYFFVVRRLTRENRALHIAETELRSIQDELEHRVRERTCELDRSLAQLRARRHEMVLLAEMSQMLQGCRDFEETQAVTAAKLPRLFPDASGALYLINSSRSALAKVAEWGPETGLESMIDPESCWALRRGRSHFADIDGAGVRCVHSQCLAGWQFCLPMAAQGEALGILCLHGDRQMTPPFIDLNGARSEWMAFCESVSESLAMTFSNLRLRRELEHQAIRDPLSGLFNRRYLLDAVETELEREATSGRPYSVMLFDIDHFKRFNDMFGHDAGDTLIVELSALLRGWVRDRDIACRYGGEEFVVAMPDTPIDVALCRAESLCREIRSLVVQHKRQRLGRVTVSVGIATFPLHGGDAECLLKAADRAMYRSKNEGRDRIHCAEPDADRRDAARRGGGAELSEDGKSPALGVTA